MASLNPDVISGIQPKPSVKTVKKNKKDKKDKKDVKDQKDVKDKKKDEGDPFRELRCKAGTAEAGGRCSGFVSVPALSCANGHAFCVSCVAFYRGRCPLVKCRTPLPHGIAIHMEMNAERLLLPCSYRHKGCPHRFPREMTDFHQNECRYAVKKCFSSKCTFLGDNQELAKHVEMNHAERFVKGTETEFGLRCKDIKKDISHQNFLVNEYGYFWIRYFYSGTELQIYGAVQYIGPQQEADKLEYQFEMQEYDDNKLTGLTTIYTGKMITHSKSFETIFASQDCFTVTLDFAQYFENNGVLRLLTRVKPAGDHSRMPMNMTVAMTSLTI